MCCFYYPCVLFFSRFPYPNNQNGQLEFVVSANGPMGIAFDSVNHHLYWTEVGNGQIMRCNADGSNKKTIFYETQPGVLSINIENRFVLKSNCMCLDVLSKCNVYAVYE